MPLGLALGQPRGMPVGQAQAQGGSGAGAKGMFSVVGLGTARLANRRDANGARRVPRVRWAVRRRTCRSRVIAMRTGRVLASPRLHLP